MRWLRGIYNVVALLVLLALSGLVVLVLVSALAGRGLPFSGDFASSDERVPFDRLVVRASDQEAATEEIPTASPTANPTVSPTASAIATPVPSPTATPVPSPAATPVAPSAPVDASEESGDSGERIDGATTLASLRVVEASTKTKGSTAVTWESSFADLDYALGDTVTLTVNWTVDSGAASYDSFALKGYTSSSDKDPAFGTAPGVTYPGSDGASSVDISFAFTGLHLDVDRNVEVGTGHFKLYLNVDANGDGTPETLAGYGLNVHVEDPL